MIKLYDGRKITYNNIKKDLEKDYIKVKEPNNEVMDKIKDFYSSNLQRVILANRYDDVEEIEKYEKYTLEDILSPSFIEKNFPVVKESTKLLLDTIDNNEHIIVVSDYDVDGVTSGAIVYYMLHDLFHYDNVEYIINRRDYGNGINKTIVNKLVKYDKDKKIGLLITTDAGSHDEESYKVLKEKTDMKILVTDHHLFSDNNYPESVDVFANPQRFETDFRYITGTFVAYYVLLHAYLARHPILTPEVKDFIYYRLTYVGMSTISDCMDLKRFINRKVVKYTLQELNAKHSFHDPFWEHFTTTVNKTYITEDTLSYNIVPMLNSPGRVSDPRISFELLTSNTITRTEALYKEILSINNTRKNKQNKALSTKDKIEYTDGIIKVVLIEDINGVQGIVANNYMYEEGYKAVIAFSKMKVNDEIILIGSGRSQDDNINLKDILDAISARSDIIISYGGHAKAIGIKIRNNLKAFYDEFKKEVDSRKVTEIKFIEVEDYIFSMKKIITGLADIDVLSPYGIGFPRPRFAGDFRIVSYRISERSGYYLSLKLNINTNTTAVISGFYVVKNSELEDIINNLKYHKQVRLVFTLDLNTYKGYNRIQLNVDKIIFKKI